ncbi:N-acetylmuramoyl-L-alanine amidase family protein [Pedobacter hartonius]|uniref:N-acetylmuramoyl-L-alanine amidase n=1 Tax=Pedobacter hartonius TaxID=425514 RepID=A0A1H4B0U6_9SPHI|nr:N-acetylmuramoyl-L-alanine amidase [Pedobacter hartonius]SEA41668.1 N-acetylmuramoyl-L-alanine amidase [Pedobacter hartonius]
MPDLIRNPLSFKNIFVCLILLNAGYVKGQSLPVQLLPPPIAKTMTIVVDAGHGGKDGSTRGEFSREKDVALQVALLLGQTLEKEIPNLKVIYTRTEDVFIPLYERIDIANRAHADLFISIHCNSMPASMRGRTAVTGVETLVSGSGRLGEQDAAVRENASILLEKDYKDNYEGYNPNDPESFIILSLMKNAYRRQSIKLAGLIQQQYIKAGRVDRGVKEQSLAVLAKAGMPAVLTEIGFISNPGEEEYINSQTGREEIVRNITTAILEYNKQLGMN